MHEDPPRSNGEDFEDVTRRVPDWLRTFFEVCGMVAVGVALVVFMFAFLGLLP
jgi:hypothetical protein